MEVRSSAGAAAKPIENQYPAPQNLAPASSGLKKATDEKGASKLGELGFAGGLMAANLQRQPPPGTGLSTRAGNTETTYRVGDSKRPQINHDNGFLQNPKDKNDPTPIATIKPTEADKKYYNDQLGNARWGKRLTDLGFDEKSTLPSWLPDSIEEKFNKNKNFLASPEGIKTYIHFLEGSGKDRQFSYDDFVAQDKNGQVTLKNATQDIQKGAEDIYNQMIAKDPSLKGKEVTFKLTGGAIGVGDTAKFPYPDKFNWQKAIGGHTIWTSGTVTVKPPAKAEEKPQFSMNMTLHAEDRYNFNPGQKDIETGQPDSLRGRLEQTGLAKQYMNYSTLQRNVNWSEGNIAGATSKPAGSRN